MVDYFTEVFPIDVSKIGQLSAYKVIMKQGVVDAIINDLLKRLTKAFSGNWIWTGQFVMTDNAPSPIQIDITLDVLGKEFPQMFSKIESLSEREGWHPSVEDAANFIAGCCEYSFDDGIRQILRQHGTRIHNGYIMRDYLLQGWEVDTQPALSFTLQSYVLYLHNVQSTIEQEYDVLGLAVIDKTNARNIGIITKIGNTIKDTRELLQQSTLSEEMLRLIKEADDKEQTVTVTFGNYSHEYPASALNIILSADDYERFGIDTGSVEQAGHLKPDVMASIVSNASDVLKNKGIIGNAYNSRVNAQHFIYLDHVPEMEFAKKKVRPYKIETLLIEFIKHGLFAKHPRFKDTPIRIAMINALDNSSIATDFVEAMRRQIEKDFGLNIELIRERTVRVVSESNLASAVRVVEKENPHVLLACFGDAQSDSYDYVQTLTLGKGIALQAIYESAVNNPDAMAWVIMGILAKTGNTPFVLAEPFESANLVVGLDWVHEQLTHGSRLVGMSRIYRRDGYFMRYFMDIREVETDTVAPMSLIQSLFPAPIFRGKRVMIHHHGETASELIDALYHWGEKIEASFLLVEIHTEHVPHVYALEDGVSQAPWGSVYLLNAAEAFIVSSSPKADAMPETLYIRLRFGDSSIEQAVYTVLALTLLNYGTSRIPRLPVTIQNAEKLAGWLARGMLPDNVKGDVAFWL